MLFDKAQTEKSKINTENNVLVSIILPVFNTEAYLTEAITSVLHQTYENLEIIIINDGSTDSCGKICDEIAKRDNRIHVIHTENNGLSAARNIGLRHARGSFLSFVDSDDWIDPHTIEIMLNSALQTKADVVVAESVTEYIDRSVHNLQVEDRVQVYHGSSILSAYVDGKVRDVVWNKLFANSCYPILQFPNAHNYEDVDVTWRLMKYLTDHRGTVVKIPDELFHQRVRKSSISHDRSFCTILDCWNAYYNKFNGLPEYQEQLIPGCIGAIGKMWPNYSGFSKEEKTRAVATIREMQRFSRAYRHQIIVGNYNRYIKEISLISQCRSPLLMWIIHHGGKIRRMIRKTEATMFE